MGTAKHIQKCLGWIGVVLVLIGIFIFLIGGVSEAPFCFPVSLGLAYIGFTTIGVSFLIRFILWLATK